MNKKFQKILPTLLTIVGSAGIVSTGYLSAKAGFAIKEISQDETKTKEEKKKAIIKEILPAGICGTVTIGSIISSNFINQYNSKQIQSEMAAGYVILQNSYNQYRKKLDTEIDKKILNEIATDKVKATSVPQLEEGKYPWIDEYHEQPWYASEGDVFLAEIYAKEHFNQLMWFTLHDFYEVLRNERGCDVPYVPNEEDLIWELDILIDEWECYDLTFSNWDDCTEDGAKFFRLEFDQPLYPRQEIEKKLKKLGIY